MATKILDLSHLQLLVIDDSAYMRTMLSSILNNLGSRNMKMAKEGGAGLQVLRTFPIDIVIVNWMMRPIDGIEFTRALRTASDSPNPMLPVIMVSGHTEPERVAAARNAGVTEFLSKPVSPREVYLRIEEVILRPRQFVQNKTFHGPDRRRVDDSDYKGPYRRKTDDATTASETATATDAVE